MYSDSKLILTTNFASPSIHQESAQSHRNKKDGSEEIYVEKTFFVSKKKTPPDLLSCNDDDDKDLI